MSRELLSRLFFVLMLMLTTAIAEDDENLSLVFDQPEPKPTYIYSRGIPESNASIEIDEYGARVFPDDINVSNTREMHNLFIKGRDFGAEAMGKIPQLFLDGQEGGVYQEAFSGTVLTTKELKAKYPESNLTRSIESIEELKDAMKERASLSATIQCFVSRTLNPGFRCSIPELSGILYGGDERTDYEDALDKCESDCSQPADCINAQTVTVANPSIRNLSAKISGNYQVEHVAEPSFRVSSIEMKFSVEEDEEQNLTLKDDDLLRYEIEVYRPAVDDWFSVLQGGEVPLREDGSSITSPIGTNGVSKVRVKFFEPKSDAVVIIDTLKVHYTSTEHWFCGALQTVDCTRTHLCKGVVEQRMVPGGYHICICRNPANDIGDDPITGGFYTQNSCQDKCRLDQPCRPEYGDITNPSNFRVTVGCVEPGDSQQENPNCTPERCMELFTSDRQAGFESVLVNQVGTQKMKQTVVGGKTLKGATRPKVQLISEKNRPGELMASSTGDYDGVFYLEKKDGAFASMIDRNNYTIFPLSNAQAQSAADVRRSNLVDALSIDWLLKPAAIDVDDGRNKYLYVVLEIEHTMRAMSGAYPLGTGQNQITLNASKHDIQLKHRTFAVLTPQGFKTYNFHEKEQIGYDLNNSGFKTWRAMTTSPSSKFVELSGSRLLLFDANSLAGHFRLASFSSVQPFYRFVLTPNLYNSIENTPGLLVRRQGGSSVLEFAGDYDSTGGHLHFYKLHALYSQNPLTYKNLHNLVSTGDYDIFAMGGERQYPSEIRGDGSLAGTVKLYMQGGLSRSTIWANYRPRNDELYKNGFFFLMLREKNTGGFR